MTHIRGENYTLMDNNKLFIGQYLKRIGQDYYPNLIGKQQEDMAWEVLSISVVLNKTYQEIWDNIVVRPTDHINANGQDGGLDGIYFEQNGDFCIMHVFQCKNIPHLAPNQLDKFANDVREIFLEGKIEDKLNIDLIRPQIDEYSDLTDKGVIVDTKCYFLFSGDRKISNNKNVYEAYHKPQRGFQIFDSNDIYDIIYSQGDRTRKPVKFTFHPIRSNIPLDSGDPQSMYSFSIRDITAANFRIPALELCNLIDEEIRINSTPKTLFEENIRGFLGMTFKANENIRETIKSELDAILFPFLNNGITIICNSMVRGDRQKNNNLINVINPQIVNGLQTSMVIYEAYSSNKNDTSFLNEITVNVRLYQVNDKTIIDKITDATNTQSPIGFRDKISTRPFNMMVAQLFENSGITYFTKRDVSFISKNQRKQSVESETVFKFWYATFKENPVISKNNMAKVNQDIYEASINPDDQLFNGSKESPIYGQFLASYKISSFVISKRHESSVAFDFAEYVDELLCYGVYKHLNGNIDYCNDQGKLLEAYEASISLISSIVTELKTRYGRLSYVQYFKTQQCKKDYDTMVGFGYSQGKLF